MDGEEARADSEGCSRMKARAYDAATLNAGERPRVHADPGEDARSSVCSQAKETGVWETCASAGPQSPWEATLCARPSGHHAQHVAATGP